MQIRVKKNGTPLNNEEAGRAIPHALDSLADGCSLTRQQGRPIPRAVEPFADRSSRLEWQRSERNVSQSSATYVGVV